MTEILLKMLIKRLLKKYNLRATTNPKRYIHFDVSIHKRKGGWSIFIQNICNGLNHKIKEDKSLNKILDKYIGE
jgi:hypothetical protein